VRAAGTWDGVKGRVGCEALGGLGRVLSAEEACKLISSAAEDGGGRIFDCDEDDAIAAGSAELDRALSGASDGGLVAAADEDGGRGGEF
jgi:hypothetical protein